jgi:hypothetical protein
MQSSCRSARSLVSDNVLTLLDHTWSPVKLEHRRELVAGDDGVVGGGRKRSQKGGPIWRGDWSLEK